MKNTAVLYRAAIVLLTLFVAIACTSGEEDGGIYEGMDGKTKMKMIQYMRTGKQLYTQHCANCHQPDGSGLGALYPPLAKSDYLMKDPKQVACLIKNGQNGEITVNGVEYNQAMPPHKDLTNLEIAEIITFISNTWENKSGLHNVKVIEQVLQDCPTEK